MAASFQSYWTSMAEHGHPNGDLSADQARWLMYVLWLLTSNWRSVWLFMGAWLTYLFRQPSVMLACLQVQQHWSSLHDDGCSFQAQH
jgi:hypothetical protein